ncbi:MAG: D-alanyl-D-alanine carboxypeptidase, partial [SAR116 cluster bacterium]|nr:D-alanyl-D-alanine carboxypeptidase [SAR116 cluster bacterium]
MRFCVATGAVLLSFMTVGSAISKAAEIDSSAEFAFVTDFGSGKVLMEKQPDALMKPASMAKIMTVYIAFERIVDGSLSLDDTFLISEKAWRKGGSKTFVEVGKEVSVRDLLYGVVVQSGNDAAIAIAEGISGTEEGFAEEMNYVARKLGMENTVFRNSTGWPHLEQHTTARALNILATALIREFPADKYPELYPMFAEKDFTYNGIKQGNRNPLVYGTQGADGLKTGHTVESGYGLVGSAYRDGQRVIMVLNGMKSMKRRSSESRRL